MRRFIICLLTAFLCKFDISVAQGAHKAALPHALVYKTKKQYRNLVAVQLSDDKKTVVAYPAPSDIQTGSTQSVLPVSLHHGYWLDKRGIGAHTAFLKITYQEYAQLKNTPSPDELYNLIVDKNPIIELCDCGIRGKYSVSQLNKLIDKNLLRKECKVIK